MVRQSIALALLILAGASSLGAQDVVQQARQRGVPIPAELQQILDQNPDTFEFTRAWIEKVRAIRQARVALEAREGVQLLQAQLLSAGAAVTGELAVPTIGALYAGQVALYSSAQYESKLFGDPGDGTYTARNFYRELSRGVFELGGVVPTWPNLPENADYYRPNETTGVLGRVGDFLTHSLDLVDPGLDFGQYDNDGLDGIPNSGDDDGFVDVVAFLYQDAPMSCGGPGIWPHRSGYGYVTGTGQPYATNDASANGGVIQVWDYMIQAGVGCDGTSLMEIGTYAHEMGHALSLPDLYDTSSANGNSEGIGEWGLMGSGNWNVQSSPAHLSAWSKDFLGWLNIETVTATQAGVVLEPVYDNGRVLRYDLPLTTEYFLLEHRNATGSDAFINGPGLLVWHIDPTQGGNSDETRKLVDLEEADGLDDLDANVNRGDGGDPYPGLSGATAFGPATYPSSTSYDGLMSGFGLENIQLLGGQLSFDISISDAPYIAAETPGLAAEVGSTAVDTIAVTAHDGSDVGVRATWSQPWLTVTPDTARTPFDLIVTADGTSLPAGIYADTIVLASDSAANSPLRVPVSFRLTTDLLALGDTLVDRIAATGEVDTFYVSLNAGDVVDFAVFPLGTDPLDRPIVDLSRPDGTLEWRFGGSRLWTGGGPCCRYVALLGGYEVPVSGTWTLAVWDGWDGVGDYVIKARHAGPIVDTEPFNQVDIEGVAGSGVVQDSIWIWNAGPTAADWTGVSASAGIVMSPTGGTLPGLGLPTYSAQEEEPLRGDPGEDPEDPMGPRFGVAREAELAPAGATLVTLTVDFAGLPPSNYYYSDVLTFSLSDPWGGDLVTDVDIWARDPSVTIVADGLQYSVNDLAVQPDGDLVLVEARDLQRMDPVTGQRSLWAAGVTGADYGTWGLALEPDGSALLADRYDGTVKRVRPDGSIEVLWTAGESVNDVTVTPDGTIYAVAYSQGLVRINSDGSATPISSQGTCCHYAVTYSPDSGGAIFFGYRNALYEFTIGTGQVAFVAYLGSYLYDLEVAASGNLYVRHSDGIYEYSPTGVEQNRIIGPNYGNGLALAEGEVFGSTYGCRDDYCGPYAMVFKAPVDDVPPPRDPFLLAETPVLAAEVGGTAVDTIAVTAHDGSDVGVRATWSQPWLTVTPDTARTPFDLILTADGSSLPAGVYADTILLASDSVANSPARVPVSFKLVTGLLALGDTLIGRIDAAGELDTVYVELNAGDVVDFAVFPLGAEPIRYPVLDIYGPDGTLQEQVWNNRPWTGGPCCRYVTLRGGYEVPMGGTWALAIWDSGNTVGDYVIKARHAGPIVDTEPFYRVTIEGVAGSGVVQDSIWIWNAGPTAADWTGVSASAEIVMSPTSGTLPGLGLPTYSAQEEEPLRGDPGDIPGQRMEPTLGVAHEPELAPAGATLVTLSVDLSGPPAASYYGDVLTLSLSDPWGGDVVTDVEIWAWEPSLTILADGLGYGLADLAVQPDGDVVLVESRNLQRMDSVTGQRSLWAAGVTGSYSGIWGLTLEPDGSALLADRYDGTLKRIRPDGSVEVLWSPGESVYDVTITPDGTIYAVAWNQGLVRLESDGTVTPISSQGTCCHYAATYSPEDGGAILFGRANTLYSYTIGTGAVTTVASLVDYIYDLEVGRSGSLYARHYDGIYTYSPDGVEQSRIIGPNYGFGLALAEGEVFGSTYGRRDDYAGPWAKVFKAPVDDGPLSSDPFLYADTPVLAAEVGGTAVDTIAVAAHDGSDVGVRVTWSQPWLTVTPDTARTPFDLIVTADGTSLPAGIYADTIVLASGSAQNSPARVPVSFRLSTNLLALGDTLIGRLDVAAEVDTFYVDLNAGDVVDFAVFPLGAEPIRYPVIGIYGPDGTLREQVWNNRPWTGGVSWGYVALRGGYEVPMGGAWALAVWDDGSTVGDYVIKARHAGPIVDSEPFYQATIQGAAGSGVVQDTIWIWNAGPTAADWTGSSASADIVMSPTSGTLPGLGLPTFAAQKAEEPPRGAPDEKTEEPTGPRFGMAHQAELAPAGAIPVTLNVGLSSFPPGTSWYDEALTFSLSDPWGGDKVTSVEIWAYDPSITIVADGLEYSVNDLALQTDGRLALVEGRDLQRMDPTTGQLSLWAANVTEVDWGIWGLALEPDGSALLADRWWQNPTLKRVRTDGSVEVLWSSGEEVYDVTVTPDGSIYAVARNQGLVRLEADGTVTPISSQSICCHNAATYSPEDGGAILFGRDNTLYKYTIATDAVTTVASLASWIYDLEVGRSGNLYARHYDGIYVYSPTGVELNHIVGPNVGSGLALAEGEIFGSTYGCKDDYCGPYAMVFKAPVDDGPLGDTILVTAWVPDTTAFQADTVDIPVYLDMSATGKALGSYQASMSWNPSVLTYLSVNQGEFSGTFTFNDDDAGTGQLLFAGINTDSGANIDTTVVAQVRVEVVGAGGDESVLDLTMSSVAATDFTDLDPIRVIDGRLVVATGRWGDPNKDEEITALDALICLSHVVGKELPPEFMPAACDVAPDGPDNTFTGEVTALDALAILSYVVGKVLPDHFRVGEPR